MRRFRREQTENHFVKRDNRKINRVVAGSISFLATVVLTCATSPSFAGPTQKRYYGHDAVTDKNGVIAPWYKQLNGQCDFRVRIAAETLKRYPWTTTNNAIAAFPDYLFTSK